MAKTVATEEQAPPKKGGGKLGLIVILLVCLLAAGAGFALPLLVNLDGHAAPAEDEKKAKGAAEPKPAYVPFGDIIVNVASGNFSRYLKVKITLVVDEKDEKAVKDLLEKKKEVLKDWVNGYLSDQTLEGLHGSAAKNRLRREIRDQFNARLFPDGSEKITDLLLPEMYLQ